MGPQLLLSLLLLLLWYVGDQSQCVLNQIHSPDCYQVCPGQTTKHQCPLETEYVSLLADSLQTWSLVPKSKWQNNDTLLPSKERHLVTVPKQLQIWHHVQHFKVCFPTKEHSKNYILNFFLPFTTSVIFEFTCFVFKLESIDFAEIWHSSCFLFSFFFYFYFVYIEDNAKYLASPSPLNSTLKKKKPHHYRFNTDTICF